MVSKFKVDMVVCLRSEPAFNKYGVVRVSEDGRLMDIKQLTGKHVGHVWTNQPTRIFISATEEVKS
jgi:hypothetical protein